MARKRPEHIATLPGAQADQPDRAGKGLVKRGADPSRTQDSRRDRPLDGSS
jgi:hypothetical protein